ncbi:MAG: 50S ribosomal protein L4 [Myxococcales bacterium]|nr:MAG: 50S ribosomal protein L4 [Myxococcales bacterium]
MAVLKVYDLKKAEVGTIEVADEIFAAEVNPNLFYEVVKMQLANRRQGTHSTKRRGELSYSTIKLFRQKGTGRSRKGSRNSPTLRGGGSAFGPKPRDYSYRVPRTVRRGALISALSLRCQESNLIVVSDFELGEIKTKGLAGVLDKLGAAKPLIVDDGNEKLTKSARNIPGVDVLPTAGLNVYDILNHSELIMTRSAVEKVEGALKR